MDGNQARVLVVDDYEDIAELIAAILNRANYLTTIALSSADALEKAQAEQFDLFVLDIGLPIMNGYELAAALRKIPKYREVPMLAVTGFTVYDDRGRSLRAGFNAHLTKPITPPMLLNAIRLLRGI